MTSRIVMGIDPAINNLGWAMIVQYQNKSVLKLLDYGVISNNISFSMSDKIKKICVELSNIIEKWSPVDVAIEEIFVNNNPLSSLKLGHARGAVIASIVNYKEIDIFEYKATFVKKSISGNGRATKEQVAFMVKNIFPEHKGSLENQKLDVTDAIAVAVTHINCSKFNSKISEN